MSSKGPERSSNAASWLFAIAVALPLVVGAVLAGVAVVRGFGEPFSFWGDKAVEETAVEQAGQLERALGAHSNWGFFHPGPALFYLLSPLYRMTGEPLAISVGALVVNASAGVGAIAVVLRFWGRLAAAAAASLVAAYFWSWTGAGLWEHWNPAVVPLPLFLTTVLAVAAWSGSRMALLGACATGSFVAQTHIGAAVSVVAVLAVGLIGAVVSRSRTTGVTKTKRVAVGAAALGAVVLGMWIPPLVEQLSGRSERGNLGRLVEVAADGPAVPAGTPSGWPLGEAWRAVVHEGTRVPFGTGPASEPTAPVDLADVEVPTARFVVWWASLAIAVACVGWGLRARQLSVTGLGLATLALAGALVLAAVRVPGELFNYQLWASSVVALPAWVGLGAMLGIGLGGRQMVPALALIGATVALVAMFVTDLREPEIEPFGQQALALSQVIEQRVRGPGSVVVDWHLESSATAHGVVPTLRREGIDARVARTRAAVFGERLAIDGEGRQRFLLTPPSLARGDVVALQPAWACDIRLVGGARDAVVWLNERQC